MGISPVKVAPLSVVGFVRSKSSADSISNGAPTSGRDAVAILPSGFPVLKKKGEAVAGIANTTLSVVAMELMVRMERTLPSLGLVSIRR